MKKSDKNSKKISDFTESPKKITSLVPIKVKERVKKALIAREDKLAYNDVVFTEPLTPAPEEPPRPLQKGTVDMWFLLWAMILVCFGAVMSYSASAVYAEQKFDSSTYFLVRYILFAVVAVIMTVPFVALARPWFWRVFGVASYGVSIILLVAVLIFGASEGEAQRWLDFGLFTIQPSEIAKVAVVMVLALYMSKYEKR